MVTYAERVGSVRSLFQSGRFSAALPSQTRDELLTRYLSKDRDDPFRQNETGDQAKE